MEPVYISTHHLVEWLCQRFETPLGPELSQGFALDSFPKCWGHRRSLPLRISSLTSKLIDNSNHDLGNLSQYVLEHFFTFSTFSTFSHRNSSCFRTFHVFASYAFACNDNNIKSQGRLNLFSYHALPLSICT